jgi:single-strand DNA-binding protein
MTEASVSFAGNLTDDPEVRHTEGGIARAVFRVAVSGRREQEPSFFTVIVWRNQAEHAAESLTKGSRVVVVGRLQQRSWTAEDGSARSTVEVIADELGASLRWATATPVKATRPASDTTVQERPVKGASTSITRSPLGSLAEPRAVSWAPPDHPPSWGARHRENDLAASRLQRDRRATWHRGGELQHAPVGRPAHLLAVPHPPTARV